MKQSSSEADLGNEAYFSDELIDVNFLLSVVPRPLTAEMISSCQTSRWLNGGGSLFRPLTQGRPLDLAPTWHTFTAMPRPRRRSGARGE